MGNFRFCSAFYCLRQFLSMFADVLLLPNRPTSYKAISCLTLLSVNSGYISVLLCLMLLRLRGSQHKLSCLCRKHFTPLAISESFKCICLLKYTDNILLNCIFSGFARTARWKWKCWTHGRLCFPDSIVLCVPTLLIAPLQFTNVDKTIVKLCCSPAKFCFLFRLSVIINCWHIPKILIFYLCPLQNNVMCLHNI